MTTVPPPLPDGPLKSPASAVSSTPPVGPVQGLRAASAGLLLGLLSVLLAATLAYALVPLLSGGGAPAWAAAAAAALAVAATGVPVAWLLLKRAAEMAPGTGRADAGHAPPAGMTHTLFMTLAEREFARARRYGTGAALVLVEIDRHHRLCQARGEAAGAAVLAELLQLTAPTLRTADVLTHFGNSQMAVFLAHADATGALDVAERIRERSEQMDVRFPATPQGMRLRVTVSAGVAHLRPAHLGLQAMIDDGLDAVAAARAAGGNCVRAAPVDAAGAASGAWTDRRAKTRPQPRPDNGA